VKAQYEVLQTPTSITKVVPSKLWEYLEYSDREVLFPEQKMIVCGEGYSVTRGNLDMLWGTKIRNVHITVEGEYSPRTTAVSVRNNYLVQNAMVHFVDIYTNSDEEVFGHFVAQLNDSLRHPGRYDVSHVYKVHVPAEANVDLFFGKCQEYLKTRVMNQSKQAVSLVAFEP
jgi:hypothetical protein